MGLIDYVILFVCIGFFGWLAIVLGLIAWGAYCLRGICGNHAIQNEERRRGHHGAANRMRRIA